MQFKYPELLWALLLLIIPIIIHLFQLRRFKKTPFTNVKLLKKVISESRRSSILKKWLILLARLGVFTSLILAFAQPFSANKNALRNQETVFYLDNSFSMEGKTENGTLLQNTVQEFIQNISKNNTFTLFTNDKVYEGVEIEDIQNELINLSPSINQLNLDQVILKSSTFFSNDQQALKRTILISDFQETMGPFPTINTSELYFIKQKPLELNNVSIDSVFISNANNEVVELTAQLSSNTNRESHAVSLYNEDQLIAKTAAPFNAGTEATVTFSVPANEPLMGRVVIADKGLPYDNEFYFNLDTPDKIKVLVISDDDTSYLRRIYKENEFDIDITPLNQVNYGSIEQYNLIVLNELDQIPSGLTTTINEFTKNAGTIAVIPSENIEISSYNRLSSTYFNTSYKEPSMQQAAISKIAFEHPIFYNVFNKNVTNFQHPEVNSYYEMETDGGVALSFQNNKPFLIGNEDAYFFTSSINKENSNFKNSPLIVPTFYNIAQLSLKLPKLYHILGTYEEMEIPVSLSKDNILKITKNDYEFIPQQRSLPKKVSLVFEENPTEDGIYRILNDQEALANISFNYNRDESNLRYIDLSNVETINIFDSILNFFQDVQKSNRIHEFWKWFAILALVFVLVETALQRFFK